MAVKKNETDQLKILIIEAILDKKGHDVISLDLRKIKDTPADFFIIAHGESSTQVRAIFHHILEVTAKAGLKPYRNEGSSNADWVIADYIDVVAHVFSKEKREFYQLEELWHDAKLTRHEAGAPPKKRKIKES